MNNIQLQALEQTAKMVAENPEMKMRPWHADVTWKNGVENEVKIREFAPFSMDEPEILGGTDKAPNPVEMLIGAAASCFAITFEVMASQNNIELKNVSIEIDAQLNAAVFLGLEEGKGGILNPVITLTADTSADKETLKKVAETALKNSPVINSLKEEVTLLIK